MANALAPSRNVNGLLQQLSPDFSGPQPGYAAPGPMNAGPLQDALDWWNQGGVAGSLGMQPWDQQFAQNPKEAIANAFGFAAPIRAFHGSPHSFDAFDLSKIGTGEGAQAYGHGLYFAGNEDVARGYRDSLAGAGAPLQWNGENVNGTKFYDFINGLEEQDWRLGKIAEYAGRHDVKSAMGAFEPETRNATDGAEWRAAMQKFKEGTGPASQGHMYEVNLHADPAALLDWDKPLSEQSPQVQEALSAMRPDWTGGQAYESSRLVPGDYRDKVAASQALQERGIPGIQYLDQGSRAGGEGTRNYVMFDPKQIEILRKYGLAGPAAFGSGLFGTGEE